MLNFSTCVNSPRGFYKLDLELEESKSQNHFKGIKSFSSLRRSPLMIRQSSQFNKIVNIHFKVKSFLSGYSIESERAIVLITIFMFLWGCPDSMLYSL
ncbi:hypothetical protein SADUNF_Sadunf09G0127700 [Salix dunnii]|uniref:Uncharacterized protein n=1 Tax=Salix dunnii TaxID=1413687 RepID=A0A835JUA6_9ROSI|nr:hypothetical protein SADUNF_Sadunf09G0127700 [Salix dunnii]